MLVFCMSVDTHRTNKLNNSFRFFINLKGITCAVITAILNEGIDIVILSDNDQATSGLSIVTRITNPFYSNFS